MNESTPTPPVLVDTRDFRWVPVCPEVESGLPVPRETLRLVRNEAVPAYLDRMPDVTFDPRHRLLAAASP